MINVIRSRLIFSHNVNESIFSKRPLEYASKFNNLCTETFCPFFAINISVVMKN